jgi:hypothetical protein
MEMMVQEFHTLKAAPEPLATYKSHLQIHCEDQQRQTVYISLTNTSSRYLRQKSILSTLTILNLQPLRLHIQEQTDNTTRNIRYKRHRNPDDGTPRKQTKKRTSLGRGSVYETMDEAIESNIQSRSPATTPNNSPINDTTDAHHNHLLYTFIIHKTACPTLPPTTRRGPTFATFDHGDHFHFIYCTKHTNNASRTLNAILQFIKTGFEGTTEAHTTLQLVRFHQRFLSYLIRKGIRTFNKYGNRIIVILGQLTKVLLQYNISDDGLDGDNFVQHSHDVVDTHQTSTLKHCLQYTEDKKQASKETITQRTFSIDYISNLILTHKITSYESFQRTLPTNIKIQLLKQLGYVGQNIIKTLIKIHTTETLQTIKNQHYYTIMHNNCEIQKIQQCNIRWLSMMFESNGINIADFFAHFLLIHSTNITKINTFILKGPTNTGKSLLLNLLLHDTKPTRIARERDKSNFHLDQLPNSTAVIFEEPIIDQTTIGTWKLLLEGAPIPTDMKHADKELINRLPIFITTNQPLWNWVSTDDIAPIQQRIFQYDLTTTISSLATSNTSLPHPPAIITHHDLYGLILHHIQTINETYKALLSSMPIAPMSKPFTETSFDNLVNLQITLLLQDSPESLRNIPDG